MTTSLTLCVLLGAGVLVAALAAAPASAQADDPVAAPSGPVSPNSRGVAESSTDDGALNEGASPGEAIADDEIIVTAQRQAQSILRVPITVTAFTAEAIDRQQIDTTSDLQLYVPNFTFTKTNFVGASFSIRGISDLAGGLGNDSAIGIHINDIPLVTTRVFETEFYDVERLEVLRGPQGTLFGRNATSGVLNIITARPGRNPGADFEVEYGNYESVRVKGAVNIPLTPWASARVAGLYLHRDGFTRNLFDSSRIDGRDLYSVRGTLGLTPTPDTTLDIMGQYFREDDGRSRIQKQLCNRDETGVLGCSPDSLQFEPINANATLAQVLTSRQFFSIAGAPGALGLSDTYGADIFAGI